MLNISANYIVILDGNALRGLESLETLDMSDNEIVLTGNETHFFVHTPHLKRSQLQNCTQSVQNHFLD